MYRVDLALPRGLSSQARDAESDFAAAADAAAAALRRAGDAGTADELRRAESAARRFGSLTDAALAAAAALGTRAQKAAAALRNASTGLEPLHRIAPLCAVAADLGVADADVAAAMSTVAARDDKCRALLTAAGAAPGPAPRAALESCCKQGLLLGLIDDVADARNAVAELDLKSRAALSEAAQSGSADDVAVAKVLAEQLGLIDEV
jgi:hypothetical protein